MVKARTLWPGVESPPAPTGQGAEHPVYPCQSNCISSPDCHLLNDPSNNQFISDKLQSRLESALKQESEAVEEQRKEGKEQTSTSEFFPNELAGLNVIKAILGSFVDPNCLQLRKTKLNVSVVLHSTPEKKDFGTVVFRLWARRSNFIKLEALGIEPIKVDTIDDLFSHTDILRRFVAETFNTSEAVSKCKR